MDQWLTNIERDTSSTPAPKKVVTNKPAAAVDGCFTYGVALPASACETVRTPQQLPIMVAGTPATADVLKCQLKPLRAGDYTAHGIAFTAAQWAVLQATFPNGVCDWSKPGVGQQPPAGTWLTYEDVVGGRPMPPAPASIALDRRRRPSR